MKKYKIDGNNFSDLEGFYEEITNKLMPDCKHWGRNLNAFDDILLGGFVGDGNVDEFILIWKNATKSRVDLCNVYNEKMTIFDLLIDIIKDHPNVELRLNETVKTRGKLKIKYDPIEDDAKIKKILDIVDIETKELLEEREVNVKRGYCHYFWATKKEILREKYNIGWKSPKDMNLSFKFD